VKSDMLGQHSGDKSINWAQSVIAHILLLYTTEHPEYPLP
jgi:hypothetical protein